MSRAESKAATREALIAAAERVIRRRGFSATLEEIAEEAGYTKGAVYANFAGRDALLLAVADRVVPGLQLRHTVDKRPLRRRLAAHGVEIARALDADPDSLLLALDFTLAALRDDSLRAAVVAAHEFGSAARELDEPMPLSPAQFEVAVNAVAAGLGLYRLLYGAEAVPNELFGWIFGRLAGDGE